MPNVIPIYQKIPNYQVTYRFHWEDMIQPEFPNTASKELEMKPYRGPLPQFPLRLHILLFLKMTYAQPKHYHGAADTLLGSDLSFRLFAKNNF